MGVEGTVHYDKVLTNLSVRFLESDFDRQYIGMEVCPVVRETERSAKYPIFGRDEFKYAADDDLLSAEGESKLYAPSMSADAYFCDIHSEEIRISEYDRMGADEPFAVDVARRVPEIVRRMRRRHELAVATLLTTAGSYAAANQKTANPKWDAANATPLKDIEDWMEAMALACGVLPDTVVFPVACWNVFHNLSDVRTAIKGDRGGDVRREDVQEYFGLKRVLIGRGIRDTGKKGQAASMTRLWAGKAIQMLYVGSPPQTKETASTAKTFTWNPRELKGVVQQGMTVGVIPDRLRGGNPGMRIGRVDWSYAVKATGVDAAGKIIAGLFGTVLT